MQRVLLEKDFYRKHGPGAYYGQSRGSKTTNKRHYTERPK
jgi:hypothetical protein